MLPRKWNINCALIGLVICCCITSEIASAADLQCYQCAGEDCEDPDVKLCTSQTENDQCYVRIDNNADIIGMGCASELGDETEIIKLIKNKELYVCSSSTCNGFENLPVSTECTKCDSLTDEKCATQPKTAGTKSRCGVVPYTQCYERVNLKNGGITERGCVYDLENDDFYSCVSGQDKNCKICVGNGCNAEIVPADRRQCQRCDSQTDRSCNSSTPSALSVCPLYIENDSCVSQYEEGVTLRGCASELGCNTTSKNCQICKPNGCNIADMAKRSEESYGIFQDLPLNCNTCAGAECQEGRQNLRKCEGNIHQDCLTVFDTKGVLVARGCADALDTAYLMHCDTNPEFCFNCKSNGCNNYVEIPATQDCLYCDTESNGNCLNNLVALGETRNCVEGCVTALYESKSRSGAFELARTCFEDLEFDDRETCNNDEGANNCVRCIDEECNTALLPAEGRLSCLYCDGDGCDEPVSRLCDVYWPADQCYIYFDAETHSAVGMGCKSSLPLDAIISDPLHYFVCDGDDCNSYSNLPEAHFCYVCNSVDDVNCAANPSKVENAVRCQINPHTDCYKRITDGGHTERGCISSLNTTEFLNCHQGIPGEFCSICTESYCNTGVYPSSRLSCYRCNSADDPSCETDPSAGSVCPLFDDDDYCVSKWVDGIIYRGCATELQCDANSTKKTCHNCGYNYCNSVALEGDYPIGNPGQFQDLPLNCYQCGSAEECAESLGVVRKCDGDIYQTCTTVFAKNNASLVIGRGCSGKYEQACDDDKNNCYNCKSNGCNMAQEESDYINCIFCDGQTNGNCIDNLDDVKSTRKCYKSCVTTLYNRTNDATPVRELLRTCLDDLELDDREACAAGNDENCKVCTTDNCNTDVVGTHISCYQCVGDECQLPQTKTCHAVSEGDQCFVRYDEKGDTIIELGCKSNYDADVVKELIIAKLLWLCEGENCNTIESVPEATTCMICSSRTDEACAIDPARVTSSSSCRRYPYTQCYSRILESGHTERGCLSSIEGEDFYECLVGSNTTKCLNCNDGDLCNSALFPADRRSCHQCNSLDDSSCESTPNANSTCLLYTTEESCTVKLINDITYRGCSSELSCDGSPNRQTCRQCIGKDDCNTADLASLNIGEPGKWQDLPLNCYDCEGSECATSNGLIRKCQLNNLQICQTVFGTDDRVVRRGCSDDVAETHESYCEENPTKCLGCKSSGCNNATSLEQYIDCFACDSALSSSCALNFEGEGEGVKTRKCQGHCAVALYPRSLASNPAYELARTCLDDLDLDEREECLAGENKLCKACEKGLCNIETIPEDRHKCYHCVDEDCEDYEVSECRAYKESDQCYISFDGENSVRGMGCRSEFEDDVVVDLIKTKKYIFCEGEACNGPETIALPKTCTVCDSKTDTQCATNPNLVTATGRCTTLPYTDCYTRVNEDGHTARGCISDLPADNFYTCLTGNDTLCATCTGDKCNSLDVFPADRWTCHQCDSATNERCATAPNSVKVCPIYNAADSCITTYKDGVTVRGCASSLQCPNTGNNSTCRICDDKPGCNTINLDRLFSQGKPGRWQDVPLTCVHCEGEENCDGFGIYRVCTGNLHQSCMTVFNDTGKVIQRGCSDALEETHYDLCEAKPDHCMRCNSNGCNDATNLTDYIDCLYCDTDSNGNCVDRVRELTKTRKCNKYCMTALYLKYEEQNPAYGLSRSCFDDMDLDERDACAAGENGNCQVCDTPKCNTQLIPPLRLSCNHCDGADCQDPQPATCANYRPDDQCYIKFDERNAVTGMGCRSEFSNADAKYLLSQKRLFFCGGDNCNTYDTLPETQYCMLCSSRTDLNCAISPAELTSSTLCAKVPYTECYTRVLPSGETERGCLSSLEDDEFLGCLNGTSQSCISCAGSYCNQDLFPDDRLSCHICDSATDRKCAYKPNSMDLCPLYVEDDTCVTAYINDVTYRGCSSSIKCEGSPTSKTCVPCVGEGCNTVNLERQQDDNHGKWQDLPLTCLSCSGDDCSRTTQFESLTCENNNEQDCMTVFRDNKVVRRGCSDAVVEEFDEYCEEDWSMCPNCKSNNCNNAKALLEYTQCIYCDTHKNESCLWDPTSAWHKTRQCQGSCMTVLYPSDGSPNPAYELMRTCLNDKEAEDQQKCSAGTDSNCQSCTGSKCNTAQIPKDRHSCYQCVGDDCEEPELKTCPLYKSNDQCFTMFDDSNTIVQMGCISSFRNQEVETVIGTKRIRVCNEVGCNNLDSLPIPHKCAVCDSNEDYACATNAAAVGASSTCSQYPYTDCYTKLVSSDGSTARGCLSDLPTSDFINCVLGNDTNCSICVGDGCNREVFPVDRQQCYTCSSTDDPDCESNPTHLLPCPFVSETEKCRTAYGGGVTVRGCSSEVFCDVNDRNTCRSCNGTACNSIDLANREANDGNHGKWQDLPLTCLSCSGDGCSSAQFESLTCENNNEQDCMTVFRDNKVVRRGCSDAVEIEFEEHCEKDWSMCPNCKSNNCNNAKALSEYTQCIYCDTQKNESCLWDPTGAWHKKRHCQGSCMTVLYPSDGSPNPVYELMRTCLNDKEVEDQQICSTGTDLNCQSCTGPKCNTAQIPKDRHSCYQCVGDDCEEPELKTCPLYKSNDQCFTMFDDSNTIVQMGCISSFRNQEVETVIGTKRIRVCNEVGCNNLDTLPIPHKCAVCDSNEDYTCATNAAEVGAFSTCSQYPYTDCYTKLVSRDGSTTRGCLSDLPTSDFINCVLGNDTNCSICVGDGCNREVFPVDRQQCYTCSSDDDPECESNSQRLLPCPFVSETEKCRTAYGGNVTIRGCSSEVFCDIDDKNTCRSCSGTACNSIDLAHREEDDGNHGVWQDLPLRCHTCEGEQCLYSLGPAFNCSGNVEQDCATVFTTSGDIKRRGCADDVEDYEQRYCRENPQLCFTCKSNECNDAWNITDYVQCNYCTSETDESCVTDPQYGLFAKRACKQECMVAMKNSHIIRSCLDDKEEKQRYVCRGDVGGTECSSCNTDNCNNYAYPRDRLSCHVCSDASCRNTVPRVCPNYVPNDFCFAKYENGNVELMGCGSSQNSNDLSQWEAERKLYKCSGNDCNDLPQLPKTGAQCLSCNSANTLVCAQNPFDYSVVESCPPLQYECVTYLDAAGHTLRGCLNKLSQSEQSSCQASGKCSICTGDKCNNEIFPTNRLACHICNSQSDSDCSKTPNSLQICPLYAANDRCVTKRSDDYLHIERGCQSELTCDNSNGESLCQICEGSGCNTAELTAAAVIATTAASLLTTLLLAMLTVLGHRYT